MKKSLETYKKGDKVKVDRGGSGNGIQFLTINEGFKTDNCNGYKDYNFEELDKEIKICEYYIRPVSKSDLKLKKLYEDLNIKDYEIDTDQILRNFWESQKENISKAVNFINNFLHPYLLEYKHIVPVDKLNSWNGYYKKGMHTKNRYIFIIPHKDLNIIAFHNSTYSTIFITSQKYSDSKTKSVLGVFDIDVEFSDDEYTIKMVELVKDIIAQYEKSLKDDLGTYIHPNYKKIDAVHRFQMFVAKGNSDDWHNQIPSNFESSLRELNYVVYDVFNKGFE